MKKIVIVSEESIAGGVVKSGLAELVDSLANSMVLDGYISVICRDGGGLYKKVCKEPECHHGYKKCRILNVNYYIIQDDAFLVRAAEVIDIIKPDVLHCFMYPELLRMLSERPGRTVFTIEQASEVLGKESDLEAFDVITSVTEAYKRELLSADDDLSKLLSTKDFRGMQLGITSSVFDPQTGFRIPAPFDSVNQGGKEICKRNILDTYGIYGNPILYLMACRLVKGKGIDLVLEKLSYIRYNGGFVLFVGAGDPEYARKLRTITREDGGLWVRKPASIIQILPLLAGADFFLNPSEHETGGLMPLKACRYGAIPITTLNGGLVDNMNEDICIPAYSNYFRGAIDESVELYKDKSSLHVMRANCMKADFSWSTRKAGYLEAYGL